MFSKICIVVFSLILVTRVYRIYEKSGFVVTQKPSAGRKVQITPSNVNHGQDRGDQDERSDNAEDSAGNDSVKAGGGAMQKFSPSSGGDTVEVTAGAIGGVGENLDSVVGAEDVMSGVAERAKESASET